MDGKFRASKDNTEKQGTDEHLPVDNNRMENNTWAFGECELDKDGMYKTATNNMEKLSADEGLAVDARRMENITWTSVKCEFDRDEKCMIHGVKAKVHFVTSKTWTYVNNKKSYGWKARKIKKLACGMKNSGPVGSIKTTNSTHPGTQADDKYSGWVVNTRDRDLLTFLSDKSGGKSSDVGD